MASTLCSSSLPAVARSPQGGELGAPTPLWGRTFSRRGGLGKGWGRVRGRAPELQSLRSPFSVTGCGDLGLALPAAELRGKWLEEPPDSQAQESGECG